MKAYLAGPFFNKDQIEVIDKISSILSKYGVDIYNPKEECIYVKGQTDPKDIFDMNMSAIDECSVIIAVTDGKDVGTLFECGYAYGRSVEIVYVWLNSKGGKFNIMLKESARCVCLSYEDIETVVKSMKENGTIPSMHFNGAVI